MNDTHIEADLVAYLDGELSATERARVEDHLARCPACAAALADLRALRHDLDGTLDAALSPVRLSYDADSRIRQVLRDRLERPRWWWVLRLRRGILAQAIMALVLVAFSFNAYGVFATPVPVPQETLVLGQDRFAPGSEAALRVIVRSAESALPLAGAEIAVSLAQAPDVARLVYRGLTGADGTAAVTFTVPEDLEGAASLVVETRSGAGAGRIERPVHIARAYKIYLAGDKPAYRPDQTLHMRALVLDAVTLKPVTDQTVTFTVLDSVGQRLARQDVALSEYGIAAYDVALPAAAPLGTYTLQARLGDTLSERAVTVDTYELPAFRVSVDTARTFYAPGDRVQGTVEAAYFFGKPVVGGIVALRGYTGPVEGTPAVEVFGETDAQGRFDFSFALPEDFGSEGSALFNLEVEVVDVAGQSAGIRAQIPVALQPVVIQAVPESGALKPGIENIVYVMTAYPDGRPVQTALAITVAGQHYALETGPFGLAELRFTPTTETLTLDIVARVISDAAPGAEVAASIYMQSDRTTRALLLRAERAMYEVGDTLRLEALLAGDATTVYLDVVRAGQMVATLSSPVVDGRATFALDLDAGLVGSLALRAYALLPDGDTLVDTRVVVVDAPRRLAVDVAADRPVYRPGDTASVRIQTTRAGVAGEPEPVQSALGIAVVDASVYALDTLPPSFARTYFLLDEAMWVQSGRVAGLDVSALLDAEAEAHAAQDVAAQAAWAGAPVMDYALRASAVTAADGEVTRARRVLAGRLASALIALSLTVGVSVGVGVTVGVAVGVSVAVTVGVTPGVGVTVGVKVGVSVGTMGVRVGVGVGEGSAIWHPLSTHEPININSSTTLRLIIGKIIPCLVKR